MQQKNGLFSPYFLISKNKKRGGLCSPPHVWNFELFTYKKPEYYRPNETRYSEIHTISPYPYPKIGRNRGVFLPLPLLGKQYPLAFLVRDGTRLLPNHRPRRNQVPAIQSRANPIQPRTIQLPLSSCPPA